MRKGQFKLLKVVKIDQPDGESVVALVPVKVAKGVEIDSTAAAEAYLRSGKADVEGVIAIVDFKKKVKVEIDTRPVISLTSMDDVPAAPKKTPKKSEPKKPEPEPEPEVEATVPSEPEEEPEEEGGDV